MIPAEIVVACILVYLLVKVVIGWAKSHDLLEENAALRAELAENARTIETLTASLANATRPASSGR